MSEKSLNGAGHHAGANSRASLPSDAPGANSRASLRSDAPGANSRASLRSDAPGAALAPRQSALHPSRLFAGRRLVVVGGTGFLGKVWVAMLLARFPDIEHMWLLVRPKDDQGPDERFWAQIVS